MKKIMKFSMNLDLGYEDVATLQADINIKFVKMSQSYVTFFWKAYLVFALVEST